MSSSQTEADAPSTPLKESEPELERAVTGAEICSDVEKGKLIKAPHVELVALDIDGGDDYDDNEENGSPSKSRGRMARNRSNRCCSMARCCVEVKSCCGGIISRPCGRHTPYKVGKTTVFAPFLFEKTGFGIVGPHWLGFSFTVSLISSLSYLVIETSFRRIGYATAVTCMVFTATTLSSLLMVSLRDPGIVSNIRRRFHESVNKSKKSSKKGDKERGGSTVRYEGLSTEDLDDDELFEVQSDSSSDDDREDAVFTINEKSGSSGPDKSNWKWCDMCKVMQPPTGAHCTVCNLCVSGYDHHCPWIGICIGERNIKAFAFFNISWFCYAFYSIFWVAWISRYF